MKRVKIEAPVSVGAWVPEGGRAAQLMPRSASCRAAGQRCSLPLEEGRSPALELLWLPLSHSQCWRRSPNTHMQIHAGVQFGRKKLERKYPESAISSSRGRSHF